MVSSFMRSSGWIRVVQFLQRHMQMAPNDVGRRKRLPGSSAEQKSNLAAANELFEPSGNRRVKIDLTDGIRSLEPLFDLSATNLLLDVNGREIGRSCFIVFDANPPPDSKPRRTTENENHTFSGFLPPAKPVITSAENEG